MTETEMQDLLWGYPEKFFTERMSRFRRQGSTAVGGATLVFIRSCQLLVVGVKQGVLDREAVGPLRDHSALIAREFPDAPLALMVVANSIPPDIRSFCQTSNVESSEIPEQAFRDVAREASYTFVSETAEAAIDVTPIPAQPAVSAPAGPPEDYPAHRAAWEDLGYKKALAAADECLDILIRIDDTLGPVLRESGDKKARRRFVILGREGTPICPFGTQATEQPLRLELFRDGSIKLSAPGELREKWMYTLAGAGLPVSRRQDRTVITPLAFKDVREHRPVLEEFFEACLKWWQAKAR